MDKLPKHLGGHGNKCHTDEGILDFFIKEYHIDSFLDVGCSTGEMVELAGNKSLWSLGVDGDYTLSRACSFILHDYTLGSLVINQSFDLSWCVEFLEHVEEQYIPNFMETFKSVKYLVITHALPEQTYRYHHVNCQSFDYWLEQFKQYGFTYEPELTNTMKKASTMAREFIQNTGRCFRNTHK